MPNKKSAKKELRKSLVRQTRNEKVEDELKSLLKKTRRAIESGKKEEALKLAMDSMKALDKAARKGIIKKNTRDRKKSRLHLVLNKFSASK